MILLVVYTQKGIMDERLFAFDKVRVNIKELIDAARKTGIEIIFVDDGPGTGFSKGDLDYEIYEEFSPRSDEKVFCKTVNSSFNETTGLLDYLKSKNESEIMIVGLQTAMPQLQKDMQNVFR